MQWTARADVQNAIQQRALRTLKQKRMYENQLMQLQQQTWNMEQAAMTTENLKNTVGFVFLSLLLQPGLPHDCALLQCWRLTYRWQRLTR